MFFLFFVAFRTNFGDPFGGPGDRCSDFFPSVLPLAGIFAEKYEPREKSKCPARPMYKTLILHCVGMSDFFEEFLGVSKFEKLLPESFVEVA